MATWQLFLEWLRTVYESLRCMRNKYEHVAGLVLKICKCVVDNTVSFLRKRHNCYVLVPDTALSHW